MVMLNILAYTHQANAVLVRSPIDLAKSVKNGTEINGFYNAYLRDGVAWCVWIARLESRIKKNGLDPGYTEWDAAEELTRLREKLYLYAGLAYQNISATASNAGVWIQVG